jgi:hypothetical protein
MDDSILNSTKQILGVAVDYTVFDLDIITHINAAFSILHQLGIPEDGFYIESDADLWTDIPLDVTKSQLNLVKTYVYLKVRSLFDPPTTSYLIDATNNQIKEYEWRLNVSRENGLPLEVEPYDRLQRDWREFRRASRRERPEVGCPPF